jgi:hypothetical protein
VPLARANPIILSVTGPSSCPECPAILDFQSVALSFTTSQSYLDVSFSADLGGSFSGTAYLMTQIGPGTTAAADQVASDLFTSTYSGAGSLQSVLQGVNIGPGTYYLVLSNSQISYGNWVAANPGTAAITTDFGVSTPDFFYFSQSGGAYAPAVTFFTNPQNLQVNISSVPEPKSWLFLGTGVGLIWIRRNQKRAGVGNDATSR